MNFENPLVGLGSTAGLVACCYALAALAARLRLIPLPSIRHRIGCIDGLRGYLALAVMVHHFVIALGVLAGRPWLAPSSNVFNSVGQSAVVLFFMITGALFYHKLVNSRDRPDWTSLYISRVFRLTPLLWMVTGVVVTIVVIRRGGDVGDLSELTGAALQWLLFLGTPDIGGYPGTSQIVGGVTWTLAYEWAFYFLLPVIAASLAAVRGFGLPSLVVVISLLLIGWAVEGAVLAGWAVGFTVPFAIGMLAVEVSRRAWIACHLQSQLLAFCGLGALVAATTLFHSTFGNTTYVLLGLFFIPVVAGNSYGGVLTRTGSLVLGQASYGIYLLHGVTINLFTVDIVRRGGWELSLSLWAALPMLGLLVVSLACLSFIFVESPGISAGRKLCERLAARRDELKGVSVASP